jgi:exopolyphosphatase/guanosine-5'-triphosphate,3'-diphosphate pyrophosphatase
MLSMRVGIVDVGSNTVRLLVSAWSADGPVPIREERAYLGLGKEIQRLGWVSEEKVAETVRFAATYAALAREAGADLVEVLVTAPGRQSGNAEEFVRALAAATRASVRVLSADEEGRLAFEGALAGATRPAETVAVCDVGGGSTEVVVGTPAGGPVWSHSVDIGCVRLTERFLGDDPPTPDALVAARAEIRAHFDGFTPPLPLAALATGGTARALRKLVGKRLGPEELAQVLRRLRKASSPEVAKRYDVDPSRARTLAAGALILSEAAFRLGVPFEVARSGLREGAALALLRRAIAA